MRPFPEGTCVRLTRDVYETHTMIRWIIAAKGSVGFVTEHLDQPFVAVDFDGDEKILDEALLETVQNPTI